MPKISKDLQALAIEALDLGLGCISDGDHAPFVMLLDADGKNHLLNLESTTVILDENLVAAGRDLIRSFSTTGHLYALIYDGYLTTDGEKQDAVFVEAGKRGAAKAFIFAQKYKQRQCSKAFLRLGEPIVVSDAKHLWS